MDFQEMMMGGDGATLDLIAEMTEPEFEQYSGQIREQVNETLNDEDYDKQLREFMLSEYNNSYIMAAELQKTKEIMDKELDALSPKKKEFMLDIVNTIVNKMLKIIDEGGLIRQVPLQFQKLHPDAVIPNYANFGDACADLTTVEEVTLPPFSKGKIPLGIAVAVPQGFKVNMYLRSGVSLKTPLILANAVGQVDMGYRGELFAIVANIGPDSYTVEKGTRICQMELAPIIHADFIEHDNVEEIGFNRGGGLGSTGK